jgi:uncharacterized protein with FMN-binding domain
VFASRFHGTRGGEVVSLAEFEPVVSTLPATVPPTTAAPTTTAPDTATTGGPATTGEPTVATPLFTLPTKPPPPTTTTIPPPLDTGDGDLYAGPRVRTRWGSIMVEISVIDGLVVDIDLLMIPSATHRSKTLTLEYEPMLRHQALTRQSPRVDVITGATVISEGYGISVAGAMKEAGLWPPPG